MSQYLVLSHIDIQNANSIAGFTWGFPAITQFLGFTHALNRKLSDQFEGDYAFELTGCAVVSHKHHNKVYEPKQYADFEFLQSKNPPVLAKHKNASPPIIEEGKMNLTVSLIIELNQVQVLNNEEINDLEQEVLKRCRNMRIAGGTVLHIKSAKLFSANTVEQEKIMLRKIKHLTLPGFILLDRHTYLELHYQSLLEEYQRKKSSCKQPELLDAWLDFSALKFTAKPEVSDDKLEPDQSIYADWERLSKPFSGYLVPLMTGYRAISELYDAGDVLNTRDEKTPTRFVEAIHSIGEWKGVNSISAIEHAIWRYEHDEQWYLCKQTNESSAANDNEQGEETINFNEAISLF